MTSVGADLIFRRDGLAGFESANSHADATASKASSFFEEVAARPQEANQPTIDATEEPSNVFCLKAIKYITNSILVAKYGTRLIVCISAAAPHIQALASNISTTLSPIFSMCFPLDLCINTFEIHNLYQNYRVGGVTTFEFASELAVYLLSAAESIWYTCSEVLKLSTFAIDTLASMAALYGLGLAISVIENVLSAHRMYKIVVFRNTLKKDFIDVDDATAKERFQQHLAKLTNMEVKRYFSMDKKELVEELGNGEKLDVKAVQIRLGAAVKKQRVELIAATLNTIANTFLLVAALAPSPASPALITIGVAIKVALVARSLYNLHYGESEEALPPIMIPKNIHAQQEHSIDSEQGLSFNKLNLDSYVAAVGF